MELRNQTETESPANGRKAWGYSQSFLVAAELLILGFALEVIFRGTPVHSPHMPYNLIILILFLGIIAVLHFFFRKNSFVRWLSSIPCSISAISVYAALVLLLGFIPQDKPAGRIIEMLGFTHMKNSWPFLIIQVYLLLSLGLVILRRATPFTRKNAGFLLNHLGLFIALVAGGLGSGDMQRLSVELFENGNFKNMAYSGQHKILALPFSMKLLEFKLTEYSPKLAIANARTGDLVNAQGEVLPMIEKGMHTKFMHWKINVKDMMPYALYSDSLGYYPSKEPGNAAVAYIEATNELTGDSVKGWLCNGGLRVNPRYINLPDSQLFFITSPEPKKFESKIVVKNKNGQLDTPTIEVNKPYKIREWTIYQESYDSTLGPASKTSVIEAVYDPWLPLVYVGIFLMLAGGVYLFWLGSDVRKEPGDETQS